jgi:hypothetical protein
MPIPKDDPAFFSLAEKKDYLFRLNETNSKFFLEKEMEREIFLDDSTTAFLVFKCMDGRIHLPSITEINLGIIKPFRSLGGHFMLGWPFLLEKLTNWTLRKNAEKKSCMLIITYHFSKGDEKRGCAGFNYNKEKAFLSAVNLRNQVNFLYKGTNYNVFPVIVGIETDTDAMIIHGDNPKEMFNLSSLREDQATPRNILGRLERLIPSMRKDMAKNFLTLILGNLRHIQKIKNNERKLKQIHHQEFVLGFGRGFDWLHRPNTALIVSPYPLDSRIQIIKAASLIQGNIKHRRISNDGWILLTCTSHDDTPLRKNMAKLKTDEMAYFAAGVIRKKFKPDFYEKMLVIRSIVDEKNRKLEIFNDLGFHDIEF